MFKIICLVVLLAVLPHDTQGQALVQRRRNSAPNIGHNHQAVTYIKDINIEKRNGVWHCGALQCPLDATGCSVTRKNDCDNRLILQTTYSCLNKSKRPMKKDHSSLKLYVPRNINIKLQTHAKAKSNYVRWYSVGGESAQGEVPLDKWPQIKQEAEQDMKRSEEGFDEMLKYMKESAQREPRSRKMNLNDNDYKKMIRYVLYGF